MVGAARENLAEPGAKGSGGDSGQKGHGPAHSEERAAELGAVEGPGIHKGTTASAVSKSTALSAGDPALCGCGLP